MSSGPSTLGIMITSRRSPISVTAATRSSSTHGESRALTRVQSWVYVVRPRLADLDQAGAGRFLVARRDAVLEVGRAARRPSGRSPAPWRPSSGSTAAGSGSSATAGPGSPAPVQGRRRRAVGRSPWAVASGRQRTTDRPRAHSTGSPDHGGRSEADRAGLGRSVRQGSFGSLGSVPLPASVPSSMPSPSLSAASGWCACRTPPHHRRGCRRPCPQRWGRSPSC